MTRQHGGDRPGQDGRKRYTLAGLCFDRLEQPLAQADGFGHIDPQREVNVRRRERAVRHPLADDLARAGQRDHLLPAGIG